MCGPNITLTGFILSTSKVVTSLDEIAQRRMRR